MEIKHAKPKERIMELIRKVTSYNLLGKDLRLELDFTTPITILTGYNGVGKSTILGALHDILCTANGSRNLFHRTDWAQSIQTNTGVDIYHINLSGRPEDHEEALSIRPDTDNLEIKELFLKYKSSCRRKNGINYPIKTSGYTRDGVSTNYLIFEKALEAPDITDGLPIKTILFQDEMLFMQYGNDDADRLEELDVFSESKNLDKTLFTLMHQLSSASSEFSTQKELHELLSQLKSEVEKSNLPSSILKKFKKLEHSGFIGKHDKFFSEANLFFRKTQREILIDGSNLLAVKRFRDIETVKWFDLSKGEKALLCLLLSAYLNNSAETVFLLDEPDLSLHIGWQRELLGALRRLSPDAQFIIATHSPAMVGTTDEEKIVNVAKLTR